MRGKISQTPTRRSQTPLLQASAPVTKGAGRGTQAAGWPPRGRRARRLPPPRPPAAQPGPGGGGLPTVHTCPAIAGPQSPGPSYRVMALSESAAPQPGRPAGQSAGATGEPRRRPGRGLAGGCLPRGSDHSSAELEPGRRSVLPAAAPLHPRRSPAGKAPGCKAVAALPSRRVPARPPTGTWRVFLTLRTPVSEPPPAPASRLEVASSESAGSPPHAAETQKARAAARPPLTSGALGSGTSWNGSSSQGLTGSALSTAQAVARAARAGPRRGAHCAGGRAGAQKLAHALFFFFF